QRNSQLEQRVGGDRSLWVFLQQLGKARLRRAKVRTLVVIVADDHLVAREHLAAYQDLVERADRLGVVLLLVVGEADFHLGIFGIGTERILIDHHLIIFDSGLVFFCRKIKLALRVIIFAGRLLT